MKTMDEELQALYGAYWNRENTRPLLTARIATGQRNITRDRAWWMSVDAQLEQNEWELENTAYIGDAYALCCPNLGPDVFAACLGLELEYGQDTSWAIHNPNLCDPEAYTPLRIQAGNPYYKKITELTEAYCEHAKGRYFVGITDLHPGLDGLVALRSPEQLCFDAIEEPEFVRRANMDLFESFKQLFGKLCDITGPYQKGTSNWMGVWHPGREYVTSCDFSALISQDMFRDLALEELRAELDYLDASIYHLDGPDALKHLDTLLALEKLKGIQWVYGAGQPTAAHWLSQLHAIQDAGKLIHIDAYPEDVPVLVKELHPQGLFINLVGATVSQANELFALILSGWPGNPTS